MNDVVRLPLSPLVQEAAPLRRKIVASLRQAIETGVLRPGDRLVEKDLCAQLNVSRTSLREALRELQADNLVTSVPRGLIVAEISEQDAENIYRVRAALEGLVAEQFAELANELDIKAMEAAMTAIEEAYASGAFETVLAAKRAFYDVVCTGARNEIVRDMLAGLYTRINQLRSTSRQNPKRGVASLAEMRVLATALAGHDPKAAREAAILHVNAAAEAARVNRDVAHTATGRRRRRKTDPGGDRKRSA